MSTNGLLYTCLGLVVGGAAAAMVMVEIFARRSARLIRDARRARLGGDL